MLKGTFPSHCTKKGNSDIVNLFHDAIADNNWGPSVFLMSALAVGTYNSRVFQEVTDCLLDRLRDRKKLRKLEKSTIVLEYLIQCGPTQFRRVFKKNRIILDRLLRWNISRKEGGSESLKEKLEHIIELLDTDALYYEERIKALRTEMDMCKFCLDQRIDTFGVFGKKWRFPPEYPEIIKELFGRLKDGLPASRIEVFLRKYVKVKSGENPNNGPGHWQEPKRNLDHVMAKIGAQNPKTQKAPPMPVRYATMTRAYEQALSQQAALSAREIGDCVNNLRFKWEKGGLYGEIQTKSLKEAQVQDGEEEPQPIYHSCSTPNLQGENGADSGEEEEIVVEYKRLP